MTVADPIELKGGHARFEVVEGLRGYMALWVALSHALLLAGIPETSGLSSILMRGGDAVVVFIIVSGFVITHLLITRRERYAPYIARRFLRLYPLYLLLCVVGFFFTEPMARYASSVSWASEAGWLEYRQATAEVLRSTESYLPWHGLAHATMLHGMVPKEWMPHAEQVFLPPAWSISLEWQFYLVAPFISLGARRVWSALLLSAVFAAGYVAFSSGALGTFGVHSILPGAAGYFALGIVSRLILPKLEGLRVSPLVMAVSAALAVVWFTEWKLPLVIWGAFYAYLVFGRHAPVTGPMFNWLFNNGAAQLIGRISYSVYLSHWLVMAAVGLVVLQLAPETTRPVMLVAMLGALALTIPISLLLFTLVEKPGNRLGARIASKMRRTQDASAPPPLIAGLIEHAVFADCGEDRLLQGDQR